MNNIISNFTCTCCVIIIFSSGAPVGASRLAVLLLRGLLCAHTRHGEGAPLECVVLVYQPHAAVGCDAALGRAQG